MTEDDVRALLRKLVETAGGQRAFARAHGYSASYINDVLKGRRGMPSVFCEKIGIERTVTYSVKYKRVRT